MYLVYVAYRNASGELRCETVHQTHVDEDGNIWIDYALQPVDLHDNRQRERDNESDNDCLHAGKLPSDYFIFSSAIVWFYMELIPDDIAKVCHV